MSESETTRLPCTRDTRRLIRAQKRGGESYDTVLRKMVEQYDPEKAAETPQDKS